MSVSQSLLKRTNLAKRQDLFILLPLPSSVLELDWLDEALAAKLGSEVILRIEITSGRV